MTHEDDLQAAIDADPKNFHGRGVLADYLDEIGDPRAAGYRALWVLRLAPQHRRDDTRWDGFAYLPLAPHWLWAMSETGRCQGNVLKAPWYRLLSTEERPHPFRPGQTYWAAPPYPSRRAAEDDAARAFGLLPAFWQRSILREVRG